MATDTAAPSMNSSRTRTAFEGLIEEQASLFRNTIDRNATLEARVEELERELNVWKHAMASAEKDARALQRQVAVTDDHPVILALIDGDGCIFAEDLLSQGSAGGRQAATKLTRGVLESLAHELKGRRADVWVVMFMNKGGLADALNKINMCTQTEFDAFIHGFNQAGPLFSIVDVGPGKEAADNKVKECLRVLSRFPQMIKVFFGGAHDNGYSAPLKYLDHENLLSKVVLLKGYKDIAAELLALGLPTLEIEGLFLERKIVLGNYNNYQRPTSPTKRATVPASLTDTSIMHGKMSKFVQQQQPSPTKVKHKSLKSPTQAHVTVIGQQLSKLVPPPCNLHYLASCPQGADCRYGHHYKLTSEQIESVRINARKSPCPHANRNQYCPQGDDCIHGHYCPRGRKCFFLKKGQCKFVGKNMHDLDAEPNMTGASGSYGVVDEDDIEDTGTGDEYVEQDDSDYSQPLVMDFSEMESAMAGLSIARGGSSSARAKFTRTGSTSKDVLSSYVGSPGKKGYRVDSPGA